MTTCARKRAASSRAWKTAACPATTRGPKNRSTASNNGWRMGWRHRTPGGELRVGAKASIAMARAISRPDDSTKDACYCMPSVKGRNSVRGHRLGGRWALDSLLLLPRCDVDGLALHAGDHALM